MENSEKTHPFGKVSEKMHPVYIVEWFNFACATKRARAVQKCLVIFLLCDATKELAQKVFGAEADTLLEGSVQCLVCSRDGFRKFCLDAGVPSELCERSLSYIDARQTPILRMYVDVSNPALPIQRVNEIALSVMVGSEVMN